MKFIKIFLITLILGVSLPPTPIVEASTESNGLAYGEPIYEKVNYLDLNSFYDDDNYIIEPAAVGPVTIFLAGAAVGWILDGVIEYSTGRAPSEWIAVGLNTVENRIRSTVASGNGRLNYVNVSRNGQVSGCIEYPCHIMSIVEDYE